MRPFALIVLLVAAACSSRPTSTSTLIEASKGGTVASPDGTLSLEVPAGALASDTTVTLKVLAESEWPAEVAGSGPIGPVYSIEPDGLVFGTPATLTVKVAGSAVTGADGERLFAQHLMRSADGAMEPAATRTRFEPDGSATLTAQLPHASLHWMALAGFSLVSGTLGGTHEVDETWTVDPMRLSSRNARMLTGYSLYSVVETALAVQLPPIVPLHPGWMQYGNAAFGKRVYGAEQQWAQNIAVGPGMTFTVPEPHPGWLCVDVGTANTTAGIVLNLPGAPSVDMMFPLTPATCVAKTAVVPGAALLRECAMLPQVFTPITGRQGDLAVLCLPPDGGCYVTNDLLTDLPPKPGQCPSGERAMVLTHNGTQATASASSGYRYAYSSHGTDVVLSSTNPRDDVAETVVLHHVADGGRWRADFSLDAGALSLQSVARYDGVLPPYGAVWDGADTPRTFSTPLEVGQAQVYVRICWEQTGLYLHGDIDATPENEACRAGHYAAALLTNPDLGAVLDATHPSTQDTYTVVETTAGTYAIDSVTELPTGVDVMTTLAGPRGTARLVYRFTGSGFIVQSATVL